MCILGYEYKIITDIKSSFADLELICNNLKEHQLFRDAFLGKYGLSVPDTNSPWELVSIQLIDEGFYVLLNLNGNEREVLLKIIQETMNEKGVGIIVEEE
jgi:hypothetical protein